MGSSTAASACNKSFCSDYMLLHPESASFLDLIKILLSGDVAKRGFVDCPEGFRRQEPFGRRWVIFVSVLVQKLLLAVATPMAVLGSGIEYWLNLLSENGGFRGLAINCFKGRIILPLKTSARYLSFVGHVDKRMELDPKIGYDDVIRYKAALSIMAAKASYNNSNYTESIVKNHWKMDFLGFFDFWNDYQERATTEAFVLEHKKLDLVLVAFRGTEAFDAHSWSTDIDLSWYELPGAGRIHGGFMKALGLQKSLGWPKEQPEGKPETAYYRIRKLLKEQLKKNDRAKFIVTGHSLGGALAALFPAILAFHEETWLLHRLEGVYTFGQPRVGDETFGEYMKKIIVRHGIDYYRIVYSNDLVPRLPYDDSTGLMFKHFGTCLYFNSFYNGKILAEEPNKNYFSLIWLMPKLVNAFWELIRSFVIGCSNGAEYKEGGLLLLFRVIGLFVAGFSAHCAQDYVNSTRLGSPPQVFLPIQLNAMT